MKNSEAVWDIVEEKRDAFFGLSDRIWGMPETNYQEYRSAAEHVAMLEAEGFRVEQGIAGMPTAMMGEAGEGGPVIAILGEFDALPGLSQQAGAAEQRPIEEGGNGHGCGHNLLGSGSMMAAAAVKEYLARNNLKGRVRYYGCPAEEGGSSKGFMVRAGLFDDVDIAICWHPAAFAGVNNPISLACNEINFHFTGRASHAAASPHLGRSALDAVELMNVGVNYMREHMPSSARVYYAVTDTGGHAPNVVQAKASVRYLIRARTLPELLVLVERVKKVAEGAALMTETSVRSRIISGDANLVGNTPLEALMHANLERLGPPSSIRPIMRLPRNSRRPFRRKILPPPMTASVWSRRRVKLSATSSSRPEAATARLLGPLTSAPSAGSCRPCRCVARPMRSVRPAIPGNWLPRASCRRPTRAWNMWPR